jgi:hypothetical protein
LPALVSRSTIAVKFPPEAFTSPAVPSVKPVAVSPVIAVTSSVEVPTTLETPAIPLALKTQLSADAGARAIIIATTPTLSGNAVGTVHAPPVPT